MSPKHMTTRWRQAWEEDKIPKLKDVLANISKEVRILEAEEIARPTNGPSKLTKMMEMNLEFQVRILFLKSQFFQLINYLIPVLNNRR